MRGRAEVGGNSAYEGKQFRCPGCPAKLLWNAKRGSSEGRFGIFGIPNLPYVFSWFPRFCVECSRFFLRITGFSDDFVINPLFLGERLGDWNDDLVAPIG